MSWTRVVGLGIAVVLAGCTVTPTLPPLTARPSAPPSSVTLATPIPSIQTTAPTPSWQTGALDQRSTTLFEEYRSTGTMVIWSTSARSSSGSAPDLLGFEPGGQIQLMYDNPNRDTVLSPIEGHRSSFAFVESKPGGEIAGPWKLWYLPGLGSEAKLVDSGSGNVPHIAVSDRYVVWTIGQGDTAVSELKALDLTAMAVSTLEHQPRDIAVYAHPDIDGSHLVYTVFGDSAHVYYRDLSSGEPAVRIDKSACAGDPAIHGDDVVWVECAAPEHQGGRLIHYSLTTRALVPLAMPTIDGLGFTKPSIGDRYVAAWAFTDRMLYLADLQTDAYPAVLDMGPTNEDQHASVGQPDVSGDLLAYVYWPLYEAELRWAILK